MTPFAIVEQLERLEKSAANPMGMLRNAGRTLKEFATGRDLTSKEKVLRHSMLSGAAGVTGGLAANHVLNAPMRGREESILDLLKEQLGLPTGHTQKKVSPNPYPGLRPPTRRHFDMMLGPGGIFGGKTKEAAAAGEVETEAAPKGESEKPERDKSREALNKRHLLLAIQRAVQGGAAGTVLGGIGAAEPEGLTPGQGALLGLLGGAVAGGTYGAAEGGVKRTFGIDPILKTVATA